MSSNSQDVVEVGAAPAVDPLVLVAHGGEVAVAARELVHQPQLGVVGVLELVDQEVAHAAAHAVADLARRSASSFTASAIMSSKSTPETCAQQLLVAAVELGHLGLEVVLGLRARRRRRRSAGSWPPMIARQHACAAGTRSPGSARPASACFIRPIWSSLSRIAKSRRRPSAVAVAAQQGRGRSGGRCRRTSAAGRCSSRFSDPLAHLGRRPCW